MAVLHPRRISTDRFTYSAASNTFVAEASDIEQPGLVDSLFERVYDDACDVGLTLVSARTGREVVFAVEHYERDREGDLLWWELRPVPRSAWAAGTVRIFND